jgi:hypothetical protein
MSAFASYDETECAAIFDRLFPQGFAGDDVLTEIAPDSWERSPLLAVFHPSVEQIFQERVQMHENLQSLWRHRRKGDRPASPPPTREEVERNFHPSPVETAREVRELVGLCVWDVFSDNHEVVGADGRVVDLGSFRATGGFLADYLNGQIGRAEYDYMSFYLGTIWVAQRADLTPVYKMIFRRLKAWRLDWIYHFPRLQLVDLRPLRDALKRDEGPEWVNYDPAEALAKEQEDKERDRELAEMRVSLDEGFHEAVEEARQGPPPTTVAAYRSVFGRCPRGWPPRCDA